MPVVHPFMGGATGSGHGANFEIVDHRLAYVAPAKVLASMVVDLLWDGAAGARKVLDTANVRMTREAYLSMQRGIFQREVYSA
jgi:hypothetical protein